MKHLPTILLLAIFPVLGYACECGPLETEEDLDDKVYSGASYVFLTGEIQSVETAFHMEVKILIDEIFYGDEVINDISKPLTIYLDLRTACAIYQPNVKIGDKLFFTAAYNFMGRMFISNSCDAYFPIDKIDSLGLRDYLVNLKTELEEG